MQVDRRKQTNGHGSENPSPNQDQESQDGEISVVFEVIYSFRPLFQVKIDKDHAIETP